MSGSPARPARPARPRPDATDVAERVRRYRAERGMTQRELATKAGLSPRTVSRIELGDERPLGRTAQALAVALGVEADRLLGLLGQGALFPSPDEMRMDLVRRVALLRDEDVERAYLSARRALEQAGEPEPPPRRRAAAPGQALPPRGARAEKSEG